MQPQAADRGAPVRGVPGRLFRDEPVGAVEAGSGLLLWSCRSSEMAARPVQQQYGMCLRVWVAGSRHRSSDAFTGALHVLLSKMVLRRFTTSSETERSMLGVVF